MLFRDQLKWAFIYCKKNIFESLPVITITALGVGVIIILTSFVLQTNELVNEYDSLGTDKAFRITHGSPSNNPDVPFYSSGESVAEDLNVCNDPYNLIQLQARLPANFLVYTGFKTIGDIQIERENKIYNDDMLLEMWTTPKYLIANDLKMQKGRFFLQTDLDLKNRVVVLSSWLAEELFGPADPCGEMLKWLSFTGISGYEIIGVLEPLAEDKTDLNGFGVGAYFPITISPFTIRDTGYTPITHIFVKGNPKLTISENIKIIEEAARLIINKPIEVNHSRLANLENLKTNQKIAFLLGILASITVAISVVNIMNLMVARILKREKFIALKITLGCSPKLIFRYFVLETLLLGILGSLLGLLIAHKGILILGEIFQKEYFKDFSLSLGIIGLTAGLIMSLLFGLYPAFLGTKINPAEALHKE